MLNTPLDDNPSMGLRTSITVRQGDAWIRGFDPQVSLSWFDPAQPQWQAELIGDAGRGSAWFMTLPGKAVVLRQYRRGGMVARLSRDLYVWRGLEASRSFHEFAVLATLVAQGLRVARPVAACVSRTGGAFYRAALITERIVGARPLWQFDDSQVWQRAGLAIAQLHQQGVWHADLNVNNIQVDAQGEVWLIDFDRAKMSVRHLSVLQTNIQRLERSVLKVCSALHPSCWPVLVQGYQAGIKTHR